MTTPTYVAISTTSSQGGWEMLAHGIDKRAVEQTAYDMIDQEYPDRTNIYNDTLRKNLRVLSRSAARRIAGRCALLECDHDHEADDDLDAAYPEAAFIPR